MHTSGISMAISVLEHSHTVFIWNDEISTWENEYRYLIVIHVIFEELMNEVVIVNAFILYITSMLEP